MMDQGMLGFFLMVAVWLVFWYIGVVILRWVLGTKKMIEELKKQNETLMEILVEMKKKN